MCANILSLSCPFCYVSFLRTKWLYYYLSMSEMLHTNQTKETEDGSLSVILKKVLKIHYIHWIHVKTNFTFYLKSCTFTEPNVWAEIMSYGLEKSVICAILQKDFHNYELKILSIALQNI